MEKKNSRRKSFIIEDSAKFSFGELNIGEKSKFFVKIESLVKSEISVKNELLAKINVFFKNGILAKNLFFCQQLKFWSTIEILVKNGNFGKKSNFFVKNLNFG